MYVSVRICLFLFIFVLISLARDLRNCNVLFNFRDIATLRFLASAANRSYYLTILRRPDYFRISELKRLITRRSRARCSNLSPFRVLRNSELHRVAISSSLVEECRYGQRCYPTKESVKRDNRRGRNRPVIIQIGYDRR